MDLEPNRCYEALRARDARFDGRFFVGVSSTGIYCRPVCTVRMPKAQNCRFFANAAAAERDGYRPCLRCRPELAPGFASAVAPVDAVRTSARWAAARIEAGALNDGDLEQLAAEYGISSRQLRSNIEREFGVSPVELAQTRRLLLAKQLLTDSALPMTDVAVAAGFGSLRRFNHLFRTRYGLSPGGLRRHQAPGVGDDAIRVRLGYRPPFNWPHLLGFLTGRGAADVECVEGARYWRTLRVGERRGWMWAEPVRGQAAVHLAFAPSLLPVLTPLLAQVRALLDLDANPQVIEAHLTQDRRLKPLLRQQSGLRVPGAMDGFELALRAVLGQQVTVKAATTLFGRFAEAFGEPAQTPCPQLRWYGPRAEAVADARRERIIRLGLTAKRAETVLELARACADGRLTLAPGADAPSVITRLDELPGIGLWTAHYIAMRALRWPDAFPHTDLGLMKALELRKPVEILERAEGWRPWRAYAALHLWASLK
jgi:AraC family transcriptional regulator, regulatory protein of adaptative response / DNA-3-methyladenine glycosylase II